MIHGVTDQVLRVVLHDDKNGSYTCICNRIVYQVNY